MVIPVVKKEDHSRMFVRGQRLSLERTPPKRKDDDPMPPI
jgi:hypothetical protein